MAMPAETQRALELVRMSRVVLGGRLDEFVRDLPAAVASALTPDDLFARLVEAGLLTRYQAGRLASGRWEGFRVGGYVVLDYLGRGGTGEVYLAEHALLGTRVAVKVLSGAADADPAGRSQFVREARAAASIDHPNIVRVFDVDVEHDPPFLVMEYVDGISLQAAVAARGAFSPEEAAAVGLEVARGLEPVAAVGLVHRDIKPANLLIDRRGGVKILDLGIARYTSDVNSRPTTHAEIVGTLDYLAPEQAVDSSAVDHRADLYALGATLYFLLAAHPPFPGDDPARKIAMKQFHDPPPIRELRGDVSPDFSAVIQTFLARDPVARPQSPADAAALLEPFVGGELPDFPARLFRGDRPSTAANEEQPTDHPREVLPDTQRLRRVPPAAPEPADPGSTIEVVGLALPAEPTTEVLPPLIVRPPVPPAPSRWWVVWLALAVFLLGGLLCGLVWFRRP